MAGHYEQMKRVTRNEGVDLSRLMTPDVPPWSKRAYSEPSGDSRTPYARDRDRILHSNSLRKLQHKTQVFVVHEGDFFRTRLTHTLEVSQIGRAIALGLGLNETLAEAIALAHDLGHAPFGHAGEKALADSLNKYGHVWNANTNSLDVVQEVEYQYFTHRGLNLTWVTREGIARHNTKFDTPAEEGEFNIYHQPSLEAQAVSVADVIAYVAHDIEDALAAHIIDAQDLQSQGISIWNKCQQKAMEECRTAGDVPVFAGVDRDILLARRTRRHLINRLIRDIWHEAGARAADVKGINEARDLDKSIIFFSSGVASEVDDLLNFMTNRVYYSSLIVRQSYRASHIITSLFAALVKEPALLPEWVSKPHNLNLELKVARFLASLTDRSASDLYASLFVPTERVMGHHV
ncbi:MAG: dNTP triphosphohydrolase [Dehalococcoidales bacterium]|nr:dNTP triphosphohydrolase [Dehalococcoidales bacterium]